MRTSHEHTHSPPPPLPSPLQEIPAAGLKGIHSARGECLQRVLGHPVAFLEVPAVFGKIHAACCRIWLWFTNKWTQFWCLLPFSQHVFGGPRTCFEGPLNVFLWIPPACFGVIPQQSSGMSLQGETFDFRCGCDWIRVVCDIFSCSCCFGSLRRELAARFRIGRACLKLERSRRTSSYACLHIQCYSNHCDGCAGHIAHPALVNVYFFVLSFVRVYEALRSHSWGLVSRERMLSLILLWKYRLGKPTVELLCGLVSRVLYLSLLPIFSICGVTEWLETANFTSRPRLTKFIDMGPIILFYCYCGNNSLHTEVSS